MEKRADHMLVGRALQARMDRVRDESLGERQFPRLNDIVAEYRDNKLDEELRGNWAIALLNRAPSFVVVWLLARLGASPLGVSLAAAFLALSLPLLALFLPIRLAGVAVFVAAYIFQVLDCADGALARITNRSSDFGARIDFLIDMAQWGLLYLSIGLLADRHLDGLWGWTALAAAAAWLRLFARLLRDASGPQGDNPAAPPRLSAGGVAAAFFAGLSGLIPFLALAGLWLGAAVVFLICYSLLDVADAALPAFRPGR